VGFFFEDVSTDEPTRIPTRKNAPTADINEFMATKEGLALAKAFTRIGNEKLCQRFASLVNELEQNRDRRFTELLKSWSCSVLLGNC
jgi:hypothetical protein